MLRLLVSTKIGKGRRLDLRILWGWQHLEVQAWVIVRGGLGDFMEVQVNRV